MQGDLMSMFFFSTALDPLLNYLENNLKGIHIVSIPTFGPFLPNSPSPPREEIFKLISYADDIKTAVTNNQELHKIIDGCVLFEAASGVPLHKDIKSGKVKLLPL